MSVQEIEMAIAELPPQDVEKLAVWLADFRNREWDEQIGRDLDEGRLDTFLAAAEAEYQAGKVRPLRRIPRSSASGSTTLRCLSPSSSWPTVSLSG